MALESQTVSRIKLIPGDHMKLYLIQHGSAFTEEEDPNRGLNPRGKQDTQNTAEFLGKRNVKVSAIWHSKKLRAAETAKIISLKICAGEIIEKDGLSPNDPVEALQEELTLVTEDIMIAGHLPFLQKLVSLLLTGEERYELISFKNAGVVCLERKDSWKLQWCVTPEMTRE
jgi:phosphohistidine phosphatase